MGEGGGVERLERPTRIGEIRVCVLSVGVGIPERRTYVGVV